MARHVGHIFYQLKRRAQRVMGDLMFSHEHLYTLARNEGRERGSNVCCQDPCRSLSTTMLTRSPNSVISGVIMSLIGLLYMVFEPIVLSDFSIKHAESNDGSNSVISRAATGIQVRWLFISLIS